MIRIGLLTSGGDCQALNAAMRGVAKGLLNSDQDVELYGFLDGYKGLIYGNYKTLAFSDFTFSAWAVRPIFRNGFSVGLGVVSQEVKRKQ